jgi:hypothetical protein
MNDGEHGVSGFVGEGGERACTTFKTSSSCKGGFTRFKTGLKNKQLLRERGWQTAALSKSTV